MRLLLTLCVVLSACPMKAQEDEIRKKAEEAILSWANDKFERFDGPRFENFSLSPTPEFYSNEVLIEEYVQFKQDIVDNFMAGNSSRTREQLSKDTTAIQLQIEDLRKQQELINPKFEYIEYYMWANILTNNGLTVYYQYQFKLNEDYEIISFKESGSIGKPEDVQIVYKDH